MLKVIMNDLALSIMITLDHCLGFTTLGRVLNRELGNDCPAEPHSLDFRIPVPGTLVL